MRKQNILYILCILILSCIYGLHRNLQYYETIHSSHFEHRIVKLGIPFSYHPYNKISEFYSHGRYFRLLLTPKREVIHSKFKAYHVDADGKEKIIHLDHDSFYHGRVFGEIDSHAQVHIDDGVMTGSITIPSWRHLPHLDNQTMIIYKSSDVKISWEHLSKWRRSYSWSKTTDYVNENSDYVLNMTEDSIENESERDNGSSRVQRQTETYEYTPTKTR